MKKKLLCIILLGIMFTLLSGCENNKDNKTNNTEKNNKTSEVKIDNIDVKLDGTGSFNSLTYKYPLSASSSNVGTYAIIDLMNNSDLLVRVALSYYPNKTIGEVLSGSTLSSVDALTYNDATWNVYKGMQSDGKTIMNYVTVYNENAYSIAFISDKDTDSFRESFMKNAMFK